MADEKPFGKYNDFLMLLFRFLLIGVIGTYITQTYTVMNAELAAANKIFSEYSQLSGDRYFTMNQVMLSIRNGDDDAILNKRWDAYRTELQKWNTSRGYNREMIKLYFGQPLWNEERDIHYYFRAWGQSLELANKSREKVDFDCLEKKRNSFLVKMHGFNYSLAEAIQSGDIGDKKAKNTVAKNARPESLCKTKTSN